MRGLFLLCFILILPALAALGHDIYVTYQDQDFEKEMMFSDAGYLWTTYHPESYKWAQDNLEQETWDKILTPVLEQTSIFVAAVPAMIVYFILLVLRLFHLPPFTETGSKYRGDNSYAFSAKGEKTKFKYKRK